MPMSSGLNSVRARLRFSISARWHDRVCNRRARRLHLLGHLEVDAMSAMQSEANGDSPKSFAWRCVSCASYHLFDDPSPKPSACKICGSENLVSASPTDSSTAPWSDE